MCKRTCIGSFTRLVLTGVILASATALGITPEEAKSLLDNGKTAKAIDLLQKEVRKNPAHEAARVLLAQAYEKAHKPEDALATWREVLTLSSDEDRLHLARRAVSRLRRRAIDEADIASLSSGAPVKDPFKIPMPEIEWEGLEVIEDSKYLPPIFSGGAEVPPFAYETKHFTVYSANERLSKVVGERAEIYLDFMLKRLFGDRSWARRFPIIVYATYSDYVKHGAMEGTGGVTYRHVTGETRYILMYQLRESQQRPGGARSGRGSGSVGGASIWKYGIESVLPHELTHAVLNEFFAGRKTPKWMHEAIAGRFEQTRDHYSEAARLARQVVAGEYFRMRDLFNQEGYPERVGLFYEQAAVVVLYLFEAGPEAMHAFLTELANGNGHDAACAAALGIPEENAVEEFERRWVEWMKRRYIKDLDNEVDDTIMAEAGRSEDPIFNPWVNEKDTIENLSDWRTIDLSSMDGFAGVGRSNEDWTVSGGKLRCNLPSGSETSTLLAIRMNETAPVAISCSVKCLANPGEKNRWFGFTQLDHALNDTRAEVLVPFTDNSEHTVVCIWSDDLAIYIDGKCAGRYPATHIRDEDAPDIDYPLAIVAFGPLEIQDLKVARIDKFSDKPVVEVQQQTNRGRSARGRQGDDKKKEKPKRQRRRGRRKKDDP